MDLALKVMNSVPGLTPQSTSMLLEIQNEKDYCRQNDEDSDDVDEMLKLHDAVCEDDMNEIRKLINEDGGKLVFHLDDDKNTPIHTVCMTGDNFATEKAMLLLGVFDSTEFPYTCNVTRKQILSWQNTDGQTPLHMAARNRIPDLVKALLSCGADPNLQDGKQGNTALHFAAESDTDNALDCVRAIMNYDTSRHILNVVNKVGHTALHNAISKKCEKMVSFMISIDQGYNFDIKDKQGKTVLHHACSVAGENEKSVAVVKAILSKCNRAQINEQDKGGRTALHIAAIHRLPLIMLALTAHADTDVQKGDDKGKTAKHYTAD